MGLFGSFKINPSYTDWNALLKGDSKEWKGYLKKAKNGPKILIASSVGGHKPVSVLDTFLGVALTLRGAQVEYLLCDELLPACEHLTIHKVPDLNSFSAEGIHRKYCEGCYSGGSQNILSTGLKVLKYSEFISKSEIKGIEDTVANTPIDEISKYTENNLKIGEHSLAGALRFFARGTLNKSAEVDDIYKHYFRSGLITSIVMNNLFNSRNYEAASFHHGIYIPQGIVGEAARKHNVRVANWQVGYRKKCFIFSHGDTYHHTLLSEKTDSWESMTWGEKQEKEIKDYLASRWQGTKDWIWYHDSPEEDMNKIKKELDLDLNKPCIGMLTNVIWDAQLHYPTNAFPGIIDWALETIEYFIPRTDIQLILRIHPAEIRGTVESTQRILDEINNKFSDLPKHIKIIPPESQFSTYKIMEICNSVIIYGTKTGVELTSMGIPVIVGGEAWIKNKGLTLDANSREKYFEILDTLPLKDKLTEKEISRALKYAFHFFYRRMIPVKNIEPSVENAPYEVKFKSLSELLPGRDKGLDTICNGLINGSEFVYHAEDQ